MGQWIPKPFWLITRFFRWFEHREDFLGKVSQWWKVKVWRPVMRFAGSSKTQIIADLLVRPAVKIGLSLSALMLTTAAVPLDLIGIASIAAVYTMVLIVLSKELDQWVDDLQEFLTKYQRAKVYKREARWRRM